jgi:hypothetical protein
VKPYGLFVKTKVLSSIVGALAALVMLAFSRTLNAEQVTVLKNLKVIDCTTAPVQPNTTVVIETHRIRSIATSKRTHRPTPNGLAKAPHRIAAPANFATGQAKDFFPTPVNASQLPLSGEVTKQRCSRDTAAVPKDLGESAERAGPYSVFSKFRHLARSSSNPPPGYFAPAWEPDEVADDVTEGAAT